MGLHGCDSKLAFLIKNCYECFIQRDCELIEINPLVCTNENHFRAANPSVIIDDHSLYRQSEMQEFADNSQDNILARIASLNDLRYEKINGDEGNIGLITNGYGLALATTDLLDQMNGKAANYFDLTGGGSIDDIL